MAANGVASAGGKLWGGVGLHRLRVPAARGGEGLDDLVEALTRYITDRALWKRRQKNSNARKPQPREKQPQKLPRPGVSSRSFPRTRRHRPSHPWLSRR